MTKLLDRYHRLLSIAEERRVRVAELRAEVKNLQACLDAAHNKAAYLSAREAKLRELVELANKWTGALVAFLSDAENSADDLRRYAREYDTAYAALDTETPEEKS